jgi:hypothetical protein
MRLRLVRSEVTSDWASLDQRLFNDPRLLARTGRHLTGHRRGRPELIWNAAYWVEGVPGPGPFGWNPG